VHALGLCPVSSQHRRLRQPHLLGSGVSFTHASSARIFSIEECVRGIRQSQLLVNQIESSISSPLDLRLVGLRFWDVRVWLARRIGFPSENLYIPVRQTIWSELFFVSAGEIMAFMAVVIDDLRDSFTMATTWRVRSPHRRVFSGPLIAALKFNSLNHNPNDIRHDNNYGKSEPPCVPPIGQIPNLLSPIPAQRASFRVSHGDTWGTRWEFQNVIRYDPIWAGAFRRRVEKVAVHLENPRVP